ncbi:MAG: 50S ribosomal protein L1 [Candidatus Susulua stagnicola]|nr:50S ribosomal protein L1 [Candidatus Susulua stagnicola]
MAHSKRYLEAKKMVEEDKAYSLKEAIDLLKAMPKAKFDQTIEICGKLGADPKQSEQMVRGSVVLPHGTGKQIKILVFCEPEKEKDAKDAGADYVGSQDTIDKILKEGWTDFGCCISTPSMMRSVSKLGKFLGPRGLMPSPKTGTVTENITHAISEAKRGKIDFRMDKLGSIHVGIGKLSFSGQNLLENVETFVNALDAARPASVKGDFIGSLYLSATIGPAIKFSL